MDGLPVHRRFVPEHGGRRPLAACGARASDSRPRYRGLRQTEHIEMYTHYVNNFDAACLVIAAHKNDPLWKKFIDVRPRCGSSACVSVPIAARAACAPLRLRACGGVDGREGEGVRTGTTDRSPRTWPHRVLQDKRDFHGTKESLSDLLITPVQRIPRYVLLLQLILKNTANDHPDAKYLKDALREIKKVATIINERKRATQEVEAIQQKLVGSSEVCIGGGAARQWPRHR